MKKTICKLMLFTLLSFSTSSFALDLKGLKDVVGGSKDKKSSSDNSGNSKADLTATGVSALTGLVKEESVDEELEVGKAVASQVLGASKLYQNQKVQNYINLVGRHVASQSERPDLPWSFGVIDTPSVNAFAAPGGYILVTKGLLDMLQTEDELAGVLGHEIVHVIKKHHFSVVKKQKLVDFGTKAVSNGKDNELAKKMSGMVGQMMARGLDKSAEYEADRDGIVLAARAGYDSSGLVAVLDKLDQKGRSDSSLALLFATHPAPADRKIEIVKNISTDLEAAAILSPAKDRISSVR